MLYFLIWSERFGASSERRVSLYATIPKDVAVPKTLQCNVSTMPFCANAVFWYNAAIEAILHGLNAIALLLISNAYINKSIEENISLI